MPRNVSGTYSLYTPGNPVVPSTVITTTWANNTLSDLATAMTDSLSRSGQGGMSAPLQLAAGAVGTPGLTWTAETTSGLYRAGAGDFRYSISGVDKLTLTTTGLTVAGTLGVSGVVTLSSTLGVTGAATFASAVAGSATGGNQGAGTINATALYDDGVQITNQTGANPTGTIGLSAVNGVATTFLRSDGAPALSQAIAPTWTGVHTYANDIVSSTGTEDIGGFRRYRSVVGSAGTPPFTFTSNLTTGFYLFGTGDVGMSLAGTGYQVGYRGMPSRTITTSDNTTATENGRSVLFTGAAGQTFTVDSDFGVAGNIMTVLNGGTGSLSVAESLSGTMTWLNGSGALATGTRTLAIGGIMTIWMVDANNAYCWGVGVT